MAKMNDYFKDITDKLKGTHYDWTISDEAEEYDEEQVYTALRGGYLLRLYVTTDRLTCFTREECSGRWLRQVFYRKQMTNCPSLFFDEVFQEQIRILKTY